MKTNRFEKALMNNPVRATIQRWYEAGQLERRGGRVEGMRVLEVGCGRGVGTEIILDRFGAAEVCAIDLDPEMIDLARKRLARYGSDRVHVDVGDVTAVQSDDASFDAVFDFGIIHHVPDWAAAVAEVRRVLRPAGRFFFEEVTSHALNRWLTRTFFAHPRENRFSTVEFVQELERQGIEVGDNFREIWFGDFVIGVGRRDMSI
jgi:ubiquinone/menaquinone biosynthesis C-methylase UbiE